MVTTLATQVPGNKNKKPFSLKEEAFYLLFAVSSFVLKPFCVKMNGMKAKKMWMAGLALLGIGSLALATKKVADDRKLMKTQEELTAIVRDYFSDMGEIATLYVQVYESSLESLVGGVIFEDGRHYTFVYENEDLVYEEEVL